MGVVRNTLFSTTCLTAALFCALPLPALANPVGGTVSAGQATISESGKKLDVNQASDKAVIDWRGFDIAPDETTQFTQPSSSSIALNRVNSNSASHIDGNLTANGNIVIINQNGVMFGGGAKVDVNGLIATTADIGNDAFMNSTGTLAFDKPGDPNAAIVNNGQITAKDAGLIGFVAPNVVNNGVITAKLGKVHLASGDTATVDMYGDGLMKVAVSDNVKSQLVSNSGVIEADGGTIALTAAAGKEMVNSLVTVAGELRAPSFAQKNGKIIIAAEGSNAVKGNVAADKGKKSGSSTVLVSGTLDASGRKPGEHGGKITVTGDNVALLDGTFIDASGSDGLSGTTVGQAKSAYRPGAAGGDIRIGGDYLGGGDTPTAKNLYVDPGVLVLNDALNSGDAGRTIFWSDNTTQFYGNVYARALGGKSIDANTWNATAGGNSGDGGFVETSGHGHLDAGGYVDLTASNGNRGTYFLDPTNITIYGNVDPAFQSTDGTINLSTNLKLWLDASDTSNVNLTYNSLATTATGTSGQNTITVSANTGLVVGARIRLGGAGSVTAASTVGADTYTVSAISGTTITLSSNLTTSYAGSTIYQGYVSQLTDKSSSGLNGTQATANVMPLWISNGQNGIGVASFDGSNDYMNLASNANLAFGTGGFTVMIGAELSTTATYSTFMSLGGGSNTNQGVISSNYAGGPYGFYYWANGPHDTASTMPSANTGYAVSLIGNGGANGSRTINLYVSGPQYGSSYTYDYNFAQAAWLIGQNQSASSEVMHGNINENIVYNTGLSTNALALVNQYQSAKWGIALTPPGTGATEVAKATASDGYSVFTTRYLERLSSSADISLSATNNINLDLKGDTLNFSTSGRNLTMTASNQITTASTGTITTNNGNINLTGTNGIIFGNAFTLNSGGGAITLNNATTLNAALAVNSSGGAVNFASTVNGANNLTVNSGAGTTTFSGAVGGSTPIGTLSVTGPATVNGNISTNNAAITFNNAVTLGANSIWNAGTNTMTFGSTLNGGYNFTGTAGTFSFASALGGTTPLSAVSLTSTNSLTLPSISATSIFAQTTGASADITIPSGKVLTASGASTPLTLVSGRNFINSAGSGALSLTGGGSPRWLVYSTNPASDTIGSLSNSFRRFTCAYGGSCPSLGSGNGLLYSYTPTLTITPSALSSLTYGDAAPNLSGYTYNALTSGQYLSAADFSADSVTGSLTGSTTYTQGSNVGSYNINYSSGSLASALGYGFSYANNSTAITVAARALTVAANALSATYGDTLAALTYNLTSGSLYGADSFSGALTTANGGAGTVLKHANGFDVSGSPFAITQGSLIAGGNAGNNYAITYNGANLTLAAKALSITGFTAGNKTYDGGTTASITSDGSLSGTVAGDTVSINNGSASASFDNKHVGTTHTVTASGYALAGAQAGDYSLSAQPTASNVTISQKALTVTADAESATYGDTLAALTYGTSGLVGGDSLTGALTTAHGGAGTVLKHVNGFDVSGSPFAITQGTLDNSDYAITYTGANLTLAAKGLTITGFAAGNKTYDGGVTATITSDGSLSGTVAGDTVSINNGSASATFDNKHVGTTHTVTASGYALAGTQAGDYSLSAQPTAANVTISQKAMTVTADAESATYGDTLGTLTYTDSGLVGGDSLTGTLTTAGGGAGTVLKHVNGFDVSGSPFAITQGTLNNTDYAITYTGANLTLAAKGLTITGFAAGNKTYDGGVSATITSDGSLSGTVAGDNISINNGGASATFDNKHVGTTHTVTASGYALAGTQAGDYSLSAQPTAANVTISQKAMTVTADAESATYGDTLGTLTYTDSGLVGGDSLTGTLTTAGGGAGTVLKHVNGFDVSGSPFAITQGTLDNSDYAITYTGANLTLAAKGLTITGFAAGNKTYDGGVTATITSDGSLSGTVAGDTVSINNGSASATFDNKHVGTTHTVTASGYALAGAQAGDYSLSAQPTASNVTISQKALTVTADAESATYGDTLAALTYGTSGLVGGDSLTGALTTAHGGAGTVLKHANGFDVSGSPFSITQGTLDNTDYAITYNGANLTLAAKGLIVTADNKSMAYGGTDPALTYAYTGLIAGDSSASFTGALARTSGSSAGTYSILQNTLAATGNYTIGSYNPGVFTIDAAPIPPASTIPNTVVRVSQDPSLNMPNSSNSGSFVTSAPSIIWESQPNTNTNTSTPSENSKEPTSHNADTITSLSPASGDSSDSKAKEDDTDHADKSPSQPDKTQHGWLQIDPVLARRFDLNARQSIQF